MYMLGGVAFILYGTAFAALGLCQPRNLNEQARRPLDELDRNIRNSPKAAMGRPSATCCTAHGSPSRPSPAASTRSALQCHLRHRPPPAGAQHARRRRPALRAVRHGHGHARHVRRPLPGQGPRRHAARRRRHAGSPHHHPDRPHHRPARSLHRAHHQIKRNHIAAALVRLESLILTTRFPNREPQA
jgi:hypothetical protein